MNVLPLVLVVALMAGCSTIETAVESINPFSSSSPKVKMAELSSFTSSAQVRTVWQASIGGAGAQTFRPAVVGHSVYAAATDGNVARFDDGRQVWHISVGQPLSGGVGADAALVVVGTPKGEVLAFDATTGREAWKARVTSEILAAPAVGGGLVVVRSGDSRIAGFEAADGKRRWVYQRSTPTLSLRSSVGVVLTDRLTFAGFPGGKLVAVANTNGAAVWEVTVATPKGTTELERVTDITSVPVVEGGRVCAVAFQGRISCFDGGTGNALWSREMSSSVGLDMDGQYVYVTTDKGAVHALDRESGASIWKQDKLFMRSVSRPLALGELIAVADVQGVVHLLRRADGGFAARANTDGSAVRADPVKFGNGFLIQTVNGGIYAMEAQ